MNVPQLLKDLFTITLFFVGAMLVLGATAAIGARCALFTAQFERLRQFFLSRTGKASVALPCAVCALRPWFMTSFNAGLPYALSSLVLLGFLAFWLNFDGGHRIVVRKRSRQPLAMQPLAPLAVPA